MAEKIVLVDGHSILNRAFFGLPDLTNSEGLHTNAVYGFLNILLKILEEEQPDYLTVAFDVHAPTFRHALYDGYKGTRKPMAPELKEQVPLIKDMLHAMGVQTVEKEGYEADDILGTLARESEERGMQVSVISGDRDLLQLATDRVQIRIPKTKRTGTEIENYYAADVKARYGVTPVEFIDMKALMGDASDNIPGVPGIGEKTAGTIIAAYHSIENAHDHLTEIKPNKARENLGTYWEQAVLSKTLATIETHAKDLPFTFAAAKRGTLFTEEAYLLCKRLEFKNLLKYFDNAAKSAPEPEQFWELTDREGLDATCAEIEKENKFGFYYLDESGVQALVLAWGEQARFLEISDKLNIDFIKEKLNALCCPGRLAVCLDLKVQLSLLDSRDPERFFDAGIAWYLLDPLKNQYTYEDLAKDHCGRMVPGKEDLFGKKKLKDVYADDPERVIRYACYNALIPLQAQEALSDALREKGMEQLFHEIEMPLVFTLFDMETAGIRLDAAALEEYCEELDNKIEILENKIYEEAGEHFNINSPKQLGELLFEKKQLPYGKKTKTGYSTAADVLEKLAPEFPLVADILAYRGLAKLRSTYGTNLLEFVAQDGRIHSRFHQTVTATGRISSSDPNLQNIPIRTEMGRRIRKVFLPEEGFVFLDADYSQIELRVLAHLSGDQNLIGAYKTSQDIHALTASQVFHVPFDEVTPLQRRNAKAVNFGIVYGISSFGLSEDLSITRQEAKEYIERYFEVYPEMHGYLQRLVADAKEQGMVTTMFGRIRPVPELSSSNFMQRSFGERVAMNSPIQGTAADIIKIAMIRVHDRLLKENLRSRLILQVHDELLVEAAIEEKDQVAGILEEEMMHAAELSVPLEIDLKEGSNWYEAH